MTGRNGRIITLNTNTDKKWWQNPDIWKDRYTYSDISRPTEDAALENIHTAALVATGHYRTTLTELERDVDIAFTEYKRKRSGYPDIHYMTLVAMRLKMPVFQVKAVLRDIEAIKRNYERASEYNIIQLPNVLNRVIGGGLDTVWYNKGNKDAA